MFGAVVALLVKRATAGHQGLASGGDAPAVSVSEDLGGACCFLRPFFIVTNVGCIK